ncbi:hypothetical protein [Halothermothrix orenii]|uniref:Phosphoesterase PA-phosphatase related n=1 Tax=Halothermothrix orenii (strain H 168 / OCM 544 / DSM 9562) TaxID=373903 RepID=B8D1X1_HALOH|nr:hypothetical protein [Halothermothrix orenii]ACL69198.1 hypothetical protein Hore_04400 [Halothermothrix orenii H 168]
MKHKLAKCISYFTVVPVFAFFTLLLLYYQNLITTRYWLLVGVLFLTVLPLLAYLFKFFIPSIRNEGREGERRLAFYFGLGSYIIGTFFVSFSPSPVVIKVLFFTYLVSALVLTFINMFLNFRASGHACGVAGPVTILISFLGSSVWMFLLLIPVTFWSRLTLNRHSLKELISGALVGSCSTIFVIFFYLFLRG